MVDRDHEFKFLENWRQLKHLNVRPIELEKVSMIRNKTKDFLLKKGSLTQLIQELGLNDEGIEEYLEYLRPFCGDGLLIWQYPIQFSDYLIHLSKLNIRSYMEIGVRHGDSFVTTVEYLQMFNPIDYAITIDIIACPSLEKYSKLMPSSKFYRINSQSEEFKSIVNSLKSIDLVFIDSLQEGNQYNNEFSLIRDKAKKVAFHDIENIDRPDIKKLWTNLKDDNNYICHEFIDQYPEILGMGIGLATRKDEI